MESIDKETIFQKIVSKNKRSYIFTIINNIQWGLSSFIKKQKMIDNAIDRISDALYDIFHDEKIAYFGKELLVAHNKDMMPNKKDILWLTDILEVLLEESCSSSIIEIENYYILLTFLQDLPAEYSPELRNNIRSICTQYNTEYSESLLIPANELEALLTATSLFHPHMNKKNILLAVCGNIRLTTRIAELSKETREWERELREELCQIHSLNIYLCILLDDTEFVYFIEEAVNNTAQALITTIIQQLTLEEIYRKHNEESIYFSKITLFLELIDTQVYYGRSAPIFTLCNYIEYCTTNYSQLFMLSPELFTELLYTISVNKAKNFLVLAPLMIKANSIANEFFQEAQNNSYSLEKQKTILHTHILAFQKQNINNETLPTLIEKINEKNINDASTTLHTQTYYKQYEEYSLIFSYLEDIIATDESTQKSNTLENTTLIASIPIPAQHENAIQAILNMLEEKKSPILFSMDSLHSLITRLSKTCASFILISPTILSNILNKTITQEKTAEELVKIYSYFANIITLALQKDSLPKIVEALENELLEDNARIEIFAQNEQRNLLEITNSMQSKLIQ